MSVLKSKRKPSQFEVFHQLTKLRKDITDLLLRDFGFDTVKAEKQLEKRFGKPFDELDWCKSWFKGHYKIMSKLQRQNLDALFNQLKEGLENVQNHSERRYAVGKSHP